MTHARSQACKAEARVASLSQDQIAGRAFGFHYVPPLSTAFSRLASYS